MNSEMTIGTYDKKAKQIRKIAKDLYVCSGGMGSHLTIGNYQLYCDSSSFPTIFDDDTYFNVTRERENLIECGRTVGIIHKVKLDTVIKELKALFSEAATVKAGQLEKVREEIKITKAAHERAKQTLLDLNTETETETETESSADTKIEEDK